MYESQMKILKCEGVSKTCYVGFLKDLILFLPFRDFLMFGEILLENISYYL